MKVVLLQDVNKLGKKDDIVEVSDGYAGNYLLPRKLAAAANNQNITEIKQKKESEQRKQEKELGKAGELAKLLSETTVVLKYRAGSNGKLFGAVTGKEIAEKLFSDYGIRIDKKRVSLAEPIKTVGVFEVTARIYTGVSAEFNVRVEAE